MTACPPLYSIPIKGLDAYRSGMDSRMNLILAAGPDGYTATDFYTEDQYKTFWAAFNAAGVKFAQEILDYVVAAGSATASDSVAAQAANWGYGLAEGATVEDFWKAIVAKYGYDISDNGINAETAGTSISAFIEAEIGDAFSDYTVGVQTGESAPQRRWYRQDRRLQHDRHPDRGQCHRHLSDPRDHLPHALLRRDREVRL